MQTRAWSFSGALVAVGLAGCGGSGKNDGSALDSTWSAASGRLVGGVEGAPYSSPPTSTNGGTTTPQSGITDVSGQFQFGSSQAETCSSSTDSNGQLIQTCTPTGNPSYSPTTFVICGATVPALPGPLLTSGSVPAYTPWDFFADQTSIDNLAALLLMCNANSGDPLQTGIKLAVTTSSGQSINFASPTFQQDAAALQAAARKDGQPHNWPTAQAISDYLTGVFRCSRAGLYAGQQWNTETLAYPAMSLSGNFSAFVGFDGEVNGFFDFTGEDAEQPPYVGSTAFSGSFGTTPGGTVSFTYSAPANAPQPYMTVIFTSTAYGATGTYQTADGSIVGSTTLAGSDLGVLGVAFPKYRFLLKNVLYTRPGATGAETFALTMDVGYDNNATGYLINFPALPRGSSPTPLYLSWGGTLNGTTLTLQWYDDVENSPDPASKTPFTLTLDPTSNTLTGAFPGYDRAPFITFTASNPLQGCRL